VALPLKKISPIPPEELGPNILPMPLYSTEPDELEDSADEEVAFVLQRATIAGNNSADRRHLSSERAAEVMDQTIEQVVASSTRVIEGLREASQNDPLRFLIMVAAASFVIGFGLRLWRPSRG
jgi:hypothetical protein